MCFSMYIEFDDLVCKTRRPLSMLNIIDSGCCEICIYLNQPSLCTSPASEIDKVDTSTTSIDSQDQASTFINKQPCE